MIKNEPDLMIPLSIFQDRKENSVVGDSWNAQLKSTLQNSQSPLDIIFQSCEPAIIENLTDIQIQSLADQLTNHQLKILTKDLNSYQLQAPAEHLTDGQLEVSIDHLTNHQLQTLAQELNEIKLKIIVPMLGED